MPVSSAPPAATILGTMFSAALDGLAFSRWSGMCRAKLVRLEVTVHEPSGEPSWVILESVCGETWDLLAEGICWPSIDVSALLCSTMEDVSLLIESPGGLVV